MTKCVWAILLAGLTFAGCSAEYCRDRIIKHDTGPGRLGEAMAGSAESLIRQGRITAHRRVEVGDVVIDTWVLGAQPAAGRLARGSAVLIHGLLDSKVRFLGLARRLSQEGFHVVLVDLRGHGRSTGKYVTWGALEKHDVKAVMDSLESEGLIRGDIYAYGVSMGAATAVLYAEIDPRCRGVLAVAPYADAREISRRLVPLLSWECFQQGWELAGAEGGFDPAEASPVAAAGRLKCPLILVQGRLDTIVPYDHGRRVYEAHPGPKRLVSEPLAGHISILFGREEWFARRLVELAEGRMAP